MTRPRRTVLVVCVLLLLGAWSASSGAPPPAPSTPPAHPAPKGGAGGGLLPQGVEVEFQRLEQNEAEDSVVLEGAVTLTWNHSRIQADRLVIRSGRYIEAEGNVLVVWGRNRVSGTGMTYDLKEDRGVIENAMGQVEPEFYFHAKRVEKVGPDRLHLKSATITTCTQPVPYWSFSVSSARIRLDNYARMWNLRLRTRRVPIFYLPYMVWPVKKDRSAGLLFPKFGSTQRRGQVIGEALFLPLGRSADLTLVGEYYTIAGMGMGLESRFVPNREGSAIFNGFYIDDKVSGFSRYRWTYRETQNFRNGFRMVADINQVSDFDYFTDYERALRLVSSPTILARVELTRNSRWTSLNVRELRREQLFSGGNSLVQQTLPEIEWRGRSRRLGKTPLYLSYESSLASIQQVGVQRGVNIDAGYLRGDFFPTLSVPVSPFPWLDVTPQISYRVTHYTQRWKFDESGQEAPRIDDRSLTRSLTAAGLEIVGPKFFRIFEHKNKKKKDAPPTRYKHSVEAVIRYGYAEGFKEADDIIRYDDVDLSSASNLVTYSFRSRLLAQRPRTAPELPPWGGERILLPGGAVEEVEEPSGEEGEQAPDRSAPNMPHEPVEIATVEIGQSRSFDRDLSFADLDGDGVNETFSRRSPIFLNGRFNPNRSLSVDLRSRYDILYKKVSDVSLSGTFQRQRVRGSFSLVHRAGLGFRPELVDGETVFRPRDDTTQLRLATGLTLFGGKIRLDADGSYNPSAPAGQKKVPDQRWRVEFYTQCCGILGEYLARDFGAGLTRREFRFTVDLRGVGKFLDLHAGNQR